MPGSDILSPAMAANRHTPPITMRRIAVVIVIPHCGCGVTAGISVDVKIS
jgi:hypothetical protein